MLSSTARPNPIREGRKPVIPSEWGRGVSAASSERFEGHRQPILRARDRPHLPVGRIAVGDPDAVGSQHMVEEDLRLHICEMQPQDRKSVVEGKSVSVRVDLGGRRIIKQKTQYKQELSCK